MESVYPNSRFPLPLENDQRAAAEAIAKTSGQSLTAVLKLAVGLGLPRAREVMCPEPAALTNAEREACMAALTEEDKQLDRAMAATSLAAQRIA